MVNFIELNRECNTEKFQQLGGNSIQTVKQLSFLSKHGTFCFGTYMTQYFLSEFIVSSFAGTTPSESIFEAHTFRIHPFRSNTHECIIVYP